MAIFEEVRAKSFLEQESFGMKNILTGCMCKVLSNKAWTKVHRAKGNVVM